MKEMRNILMTAALVMTGILMSCGGGDDGPGLTAGQQLINDLEAAGTVTVTATGSSVGDATAVTLASVTVKFTGNSDDTGMTFTLTGGNVQDFVSGGSFDVSAAGAISNGQLTKASSATDVTLSGASVAYSSSAGTVTVEFDLAAAGTRSAGVGSYKFIFSVS